MSETNYSSKRDDLDIESLLFNKSFTGENTG